jgi:hypothetical protein
MPVYKIFSKECHCNGEGWDDYGLLVCSDGKTTHIMRWCFVREETGIGCNLPLKQRDYIGKTEFAKIDGRDPNTLPIVQDNRNSDNPVCGYNGCISNETQKHHYGFKRIFNVEDFEEADNWPVLPLCKEHHDYFHKKVEVYWKEHFVKEDA